MQGLEEPKGLREWPGGHKMGIFRATRTRIPFSAEYLPEYSVVPLASKVNQTAV